VASASFASCILLFAVLAPTGPGAVSSGPVPEACDVKPLSLPERVAQTIMMGIPATNLGPEAAGLVARYAGAVVLQQTNVRDVAQLSALTRTLHQTGRHRLLVAVDEEGGRVSRLGAQGVSTLLPAPRTLAASRSPEEVRRLGARIGAELRKLGIDWNLAPVLDVTDAPVETVIGDRAYGGDPQTVTAFGRAFAAGLAEAGLLTTGKHFPGHGATAVDSHETLPTVTGPVEALGEHVLPYREVHPVLDSVMTAHVTFTALDPDRPASLSPAVTRLLREDVGFGGLVITDALEMDAITERWTIPEAAELALRAGADMVLVGPWQHVEGTAARLVDAVRAGRVPQWRLDQAADRVLTLKGYDPSTAACLLA
jgi:beta-N-acetylhexosaminidase